MRYWCQVWLTIFSCVSDPQAEANPQLKGLKQAKLGIIKTIKSGGRDTLIWLSINLEAHELITAAIHNQAKQASTVLEAADMLMTAVQHEIENNPANFGKFLTALRSSDLNHDADMLETDMVS